MKPLYKVLKHAIHICVKHQNPKIYEANIDRLKEEIQFYCNKWRLLYSNSIMDRLTRENINKEIEDLNNTTNQLYLTHRTLHPTAAK